MAECLSIRAINLHTDSRKKQQLMLKSTGMWESNEEAERMRCFPKFSIRKIPGSDKGRSCLEEGRSGDNLIGLTSSIVRTRTSVAVVYYCNQPEHWKPGLAPSNA